jgi:hypothetical protein
MPRIAGVRHVEEWATTHCTDVSKLTFAYGADHPLVQSGSWTTRKRKNGETEWIPPPHLDHGQPRTNPFHHPEKLLRDAAEYDTGGQALIRYGGEGSLVLPITKRGVA